MPLPAAPPLVPPLPGPAEDADRRDHTRMRRRIVDGQWRWDLLQKLLDFFPASTVDRLGHIDQSRNLLATVSRQMAVLYSEAPVLAHGAVTQDALDAFVALVGEAGTWQLGLRWQRYAWALRDCLVRASWVAGPDGAPGTPQVRVVTPDLVYAEASGDSPEDPLLVVEARLRKVDGKMVWTWDVLDVRDPASPVYSVRLASGARWEDAPDLSEQLLGGQFSGSAYPYIVDGRPVVPYAAYHAARSGMLWDPYEGREGVDGTLHVAALWSFWSYCVRDASYPLRYLIDGLVAGGASKQGSGTTQRSELAVDPTVLLMLRSESGKSVQAGQWAAAADPERLQLAIDAYELRTLNHMGLAPGDLQRTGGAESGYAISLRRDSVREAQRTMEPQMRRGDERLLALLASLSNRHGGTALPESGWQITYPGLPLSPEERKAQTEETAAQVSAGLMGPVGAYQSSHPGTSREAAIVALASIAIEGDEVDAAARALRSGVAPRTATLDASTLAEVRTTLEKVEGKSLPVESARVYLVSLLGVPAEVAESLLAPLAVEVEPEPVPAGLVPFQPGQPPPSQTEEEPEAPEESPVDEMDDEEHTDD